MRVCVCIVNIYIYIDIGILEHIADEHQRSHGFVGAHWAQDLHMEFTGPGNSLQAASDGVRGCITLRSIQMGNHQVDQCVASGRH